jgi:transposase
MFGADRHALLHDIFAEDVPVWLRQAPAIETLRRVWVQQYYVQGGAITWRTQQKEGMPRSDHFTSSSYDPDAHLARKHSTHWTGYKVHLTESCEEDQPDLLEWLPALLPMAIWRQISIKL